MVALRECVYKFVYTCVCVWGMGTSCEGGGGEAPLVKLTVKLMTRTVGACGRHPYALVKKMVKLTVKHLVGGAEGLAPGPWGRRSGQTK